MDASLNLPRESYSHGVRRRRHLSDKDYVLRVREMMAGHAKAAKRERARTGKRVLCIRSVVAQDPHQRRRHGKSGPAPGVRAVVKKTKATFKKAYYSFVGAYREALAALYAGVEEARFPSGGIAPGSTCPRNRSG